MQILDYKTRVWQEVLSNKEKSPLPIIIPVVLYHGRKPWGRRRFRDLFKPEPKTRRYVKRYALKIPYEMCDLRIDPLDGLEGEPKLAIVLNSLKYSRSSELGERLPHIMELLAGLHGMDSGDHAKTRNNIGYTHAVLEYLSEMGATIGLIALNNAVEQHLPGEIGENAMATIAETLRQEGRQEGAVLALQSALRDLLTLRFGAVPEWAEKRISHAQTGELNGWISRTVAAGSTEDVFSAAN